MLFKLDEDEKISLLEEYLNINCIIYNEELIKKEFEEFEKMYSPYNAKCNAGVRGYEQYTDFYVSFKKNELLNRLFREYPGMNDWARRLKFQLLKMKDSLIREAGMTIGVKPNTLLSSEILFNEQRAKEYLASLRIKKTSDRLYKKK